MFDDEPVKKPAGHIVGCDVAAFSIEELEKRIMELSDEIHRLQQVVTTKHASMASAESFFKK